MKILDPMVAAFNVLNNHQLEHCLRVLQSRIAARQALLATQIAGVTLYSAQQTPHTANQYMHQALELAGEIEKLQECFEQASDQLAHNRTCKIQDVQ